MKIRPQDTSGHMLRRLQQVMVVVPVDAYVDKAQHITGKYRHQWSQGGKRGSIWRLHLQHHNGDNDGEYPVTESLHTSFAHHCEFLAGPRCLSRCSFPCMSLPSAHLLNRLQASRKPIPVWSQPSTRNHLR